MSANSTALPQDSALPVLTNGSNDTADNGTLPFPETGGLQDTSGCPTCKCAGNSERAHVWTMSDRDHIVYCMENVVCVYHFVRLHFQPFHTDRLIWNRDPD